MPTSTEEELISSFQEIINRRRSIAFGAHEDYDEWIEFHKKKRQDICRLFGATKDFPKIREVVWQYIKDCLDDCVDFFSIDTLCAWHTSDFSDEEIVDYIEEKVRELANKLLETESGKKIVKKIVNREYVILSSGIVSIFKERMQGTI